MDRCIQKASPVAHGRTEKRELKRSKPSSECVCGKGPLMQTWDTLLALGLWGVLPSMWGCQFPSHQKKKEVHGGLAFHKRTIVFQTRPVRFHPFDARVLILRKQAAFDHHWLFDGGTGPSKMPSNCMPRVDGKPRIESRVCLCTPALLRGGGST